MEHTGKGGNVVGDNVAQPHVLNIVEMSSIVRRSKSAVKARLRRSSVTDAQLSHSIVRNVDESDPVVCPHRSCAQRGGRGLASPSSTLKRFAVSVASAAVVRAAMAAAAEPPSTATVTSLHAVIASASGGIHCLLDRTRHSRASRSRPEHGRTAEFASEHFDRRSGMKDQEHAHVHVHVSGEFDVLRERERISCYFCNLQGATVEEGRKTRSPDRTPSVLAAPKVLSGADAACALTGHTLQPQSIERDCLLEIVLVSLGPTQRLCLMRAAISITRIPNRFSAVMAVMAGCS